MPQIKRLLARFRNFFRPSRAEEDLCREVQSHLTLMEDDFRRQGLTVDEARMAARRTFGGVEQAKERHRDVRSFAWLDDARQDVGYAVRCLQRQPGFAILGVLTMALGIGANAAVFSVVNTVLLKPLPYRDPERIVTLSTVAERTGGGASRLLSRQIADADFLDWRSQTRNFDAMAYYATRAASIMAGAQAEYARVSRVSGEFFDVLAVRPTAGRLFDAEEIRPGANGAVVVSDSFARSHFGGSAQAVGRTLRLFNRSVSIVGVAPSGFGFPEGTEIWAPIPADPATMRRRALNFRAAGRLKAGVSLEQAQSEMTTIAGHLEQQYPDSNMGRSVEVERLHDQMVGDVRLMLYVLLGAVGLVLLIGCTNLATLLLVRATARAQEVTLRAALGASRGRIVRQMLVEGMTLGLVAGAAGLGLAVVSLQALVALIPADVPRLAEITIDGRVLIFTLLVSVVSSMLLAVAPAFQASQVHLESGLREGSTGSVTGGRTRRVREALVVAQLAMAVVLLASGGLVIRSFVALQNVPLGFRPQNVLVVDATVATPDPRQGASLFFRDLLREMSRVPGVVAAGATMSAPGRVDSTGGYFVDHVPQPSERPSGPSAVLSIVAPGTFKALGIPLVSGREFDDRDIREAPMTAIVNEALARRALAGQGAIGHTIVCAFDTIEPMTIVGIVRDVRQTGPARESQPECYMPYLQHPYNGATLSLVIRTTTEPMLLAETVRRKAQALAPDVPVKFTTLETLTAQNVAEPRFRAMLLGAFGAVALMLATIGVFGVMAYVVSQRTREIGLRLALGATSGHILRLFLSRGVALTTIGLAIGFIGATTASRFFTGLLFAIEPTDPMTYLGVAALLGTAALLALYVPVRRAMNVDPLIALRSE